MTPREDAIHLAAQCWCDVNTSHVEMNPALAMAFAKRLEMKMQEIDSLKQQVEELKIAVDLYEFEFNRAKELDAQLKTRDEVIELAVEALRSVSSFNKNDGNAPSDNRGPDSMSYWRWQELISRDISRNAIEQVNTLLGREG